jgi:hypothetical protein
MTHYCNGNPCTICHPVYQTTCAAPPTFQTWSGVVNATWPPGPARLHPDDIEAIAKRVAELLAK